MRSQPANSHKIVPAGKTMIHRESPAIRPHVTLTARARSQFSRSHTLSHRRRRYPPCRCRWRRPRLPDVALHWRWTLWRARWSVDAWNRTTSRRLSCTPLIWLRPVRPVRAAVCCSRHPDSANEILIRKLQNGVISIDIQGADE